MTLGTNVAGGVHVHGQHGADENWLTGSRAAQIVNGFKHALQYKGQATLSMRHMLIKFTDYMARQTSTLEQWHEEWEMKLTGECPDDSGSAETNMAGSSLASALPDSSHKTQYIANYIAQCLDVYLVEVVFVTLQPLC